MLIIFKCTNFFLNAQHVSVAKYSHLQGVTVLDETCSVLSKISDVFFPLAPRPNVGHGLIILEVSRSHTTTQHTVGRTPLYQ